MQLMIPASVILSRSFVLQTRLKGSTSRLGSRLPQGTQRHSTRRGPDVARGGGSMRPLPNYFSQFSLLLVSSDSFFLQYLYARCSLLHSIIQRHQPSAFLSGIVFSSDFSNHTFSMFLRLLLISFSGWFFSIFC